MAEAAPTPDACPRSSLAATRVPSHLKLRPCFGGPAARDIDLVLKTQGGSQGPPPRCHLPLPPHPSHPATLTPCPPTRAQAHGRRIRQRFFAKIESRAWNRPPQLRIRNPDRIPAPICTRIRFPAGAEGTSAPPTSTCRGNPCGCPPTRTRITLMPSLSDHHPRSAQGPLTLRLSKGEPGGGSRRGVAVPKVPGNCLPRTIRGPSVLSGIRFAHPFRGIGLLSGDRRLKPAIARQPKAGPRFKRSLNRHNLQAAPDFTSHIDSRICAATPQARRSRKKTRWHDSNRLKSNLRLTGGGRHALP